MSDYHKEFKGKDYKYNKPGLEKTFYDAIFFAVHDPFGNTILFNEKYDESKHKNIEFNSIH